VKLIGITGSCGKTSTAEIVYQYLLYSGRGASLYGSNGLFVNGLTREKDFLQTTPYLKELEVHLDDDRESGVEYGIVEISAESVNRGDRVHVLQYDILALTSFYERLHNHFDGKEHYAECKRKILTTPNVKKVLMRLEDEGYTYFSDIPHTTYGYGENVTHRMQVIRNEMDGLTLYYQGVKFKTNLITAYHARNMACALAILTELGVLDMEKFVEFAKGINIRGRFEKLNVGGKTVIIDTGLAGALITLVGIEKPFDSTNYRIIYSSVHYREENEWVREARDRAGRYLKRGNFIYLTNPEGVLGEEEVFLKDVVKEEGYDKYRYIPDINEACKAALNELAPGEILIVFSREHYRKYRECFEKLR